MTTTVPAVERGGRKRRLDDRPFLLAVLAAALLARLEGLLWPLKPDESGLLLVSRSWHPEADSIYGFFFVDRSPVLIALYRLADLVGGSYTPRAVAAGLGVLMVLAAYRIGRLLGGRRSARWTAVLAVALSWQPDLELWAAKSESLGVPLVVTSCWLALEALLAHSSRNRLICATAAGFTGALAMGMKQNLVGGAVFGAVALAVAALAGELPLREGRRLLAAATAGFAAPVLAVVAWALAAGVHLGTLWQTLYGFRAEALRTIEEQSTAAPETRLSDLVALFVGSGMVVVLVWFAVRLAPAARRNRPVTMAAVAMLAVDVLLLVLGGSFWLPYLTALFPGLLVAVALVTSLPRGASVRGMQAAVALCVVAAVVAVSTWVPPHLDGRAVPSAHYVGQAVGEAAHQGDTIVVLYGRADVVLASGLRSPYEHLWSLPARTLDPGLARLQALLAADRAPTWVVVYVPVDSWGIDSDGRLAELLRSRYQEVADVCGTPVLLRKDVGRPVLPPVDCHQPWR